MRFIVKNLLKIIEIKKWVFEMRDRIDVFLFILIEKGK